jgi:type 1 fimbria pilin
MKTLAFSLASVMLLVAGAATMPVRAQHNHAEHGPDQHDHAHPAAATVTLKGQIVCSTCWFEADRKTVAYGTDADKKCAVRCAKGDIPGALAVTENGETRLYILEDGMMSLTKHGKDWTEYTGVQAEVSGTARHEGDKHYLKVDSIKVIPAGS